MHDLLKWLGLPDSILGGPWFNSCLYIFGWVTGYWVCARQNRREEARRLGKPPG